MEDNNLKESVDTLRDEKEKLFSRKQELSDKIREAIAKIKEHRERRDELTKQVHELKPKRDELNAKIKELIERIKTLPEEPAKPRGPSAVMIKRQIESMQKKIETEAISFEKEKAMMKQLKEKQKLLLTLDKERSDNYARGDIGRQLSRLKKESDEVHKKIQKMAEDSQKEHEFLLNISKNIDELRSEEATIRNSISSIKTELKDKVSHIPREKRPKSMQVSKRLEKQVEQVEEKIKEKKKLTTEDLLAFQSKL